jgi:hypothetical protein
VHVSPHDGRSDQPVLRETAKRFKQEKTMTKKSHFVSAALALATLATVSFATAPAQAAEVACKTGGAVQGCVAATTAPAVVAPVAVSHVGYTRVTPYGVRHASYTRVWR